MSLTAAVASLQSWWTLWTHGQGKQPSGCSCCLYHGLGLKCLLCSQPLGLAAFTVLSPVAGSRHSQQQVMQNQCPGRLTFPANLTNSMNEAPRICSGFVGAKRDSNINPGVTWEAAPSQPSPSLDTTSTQTIPNCPLMHGAAWMTSKARCRRSSYWPLWASSEQVVVHCPGLARQPFPSTTGTWKTH